MNNKPIIWFTGQPNSGKTTLALELIQYFGSVNKTVIHIDGDKLRNVLNNKDYTKRGRLFNVEVAQAIATASAAQSHIDYTIVSMVSPYKNQREYFKKTNNVIEIYLKSTRIREGKMLQDYEPPTNNYIELDTDTYDVSSCLNILIEYINKHN